MRVGDHKLKTHRLRVDEIVPAKANPASPRATDLEAAGRGGVCTYTLLPIHNRSGAGGQIKRQGIKKWSFPSCGDQALKRRHGLHQCNILSTAEVSSVDAVKPHGLIGLVLSWLHGGCCRGRGAISVIQLPVGPKLWGCRPACGLGQSDCHAVPHSSTSRVPGGFVARAPPVVVRVYSEILHSCGGVFTLDHGITSSLSVDIVEGSSALSLQPLGGISLILVLNGLCLGGLCVGVSVVVHPLKSWSCPGLRRAKAHGSYRERVIAHIVIMDLHLCSGLHLRELLQVGPVDALSLSFGGPVRDRDPKRLPDIIHHLVKRRFHDETVCKAILLHFTYAENLDSDLLGSLASSA